MFTQILKRILLLAIFHKTSCEYDNRVITTLKYSQYRVQPVIVNGNPASKGQVPFLVSFKEPGGSLGKTRVVWKNLCGGTILNESKILTAAHCFELNDFHYAKHPNLLRIVAGNLKNDLVHSGRTDTGDESQWRSIKVLKMHQRFSFPNNDIALVFVDKPFKISDTVDYIVPAVYNTDYPKSCFSAGFGRTSHDDGKFQGSPVMLLAKIEPMSRFKCTVLWGMNMNNFICTHSVISDVAMGDSGGPLACVGTLDPMERSSGRKVLVGVVSGKNFDKTTLYTRVSRYIDWIKSDGTNSSGILQLNWCLLLITWFGLIYLLFYFARFFFNSRNKTYGKINCRKSLSIFHP